MATATPGVSIDALLRGHPEAVGLPLELVSGAAGLDRRITSPHIQKTGLALAGFDAYLSPGRILVLGESEVRYLESLTSSSRVDALRRTFAHEIPAVMLSGGFAPPRELAMESDRAGVPLLCTAVPTPFAIAKVSAILEDSLAERTIVHAVLMDILGLGVLIVGESGIGKSECALDLVMDGHRLVADDVVNIKRRGHDVIYGASTDLTKHHMEVRGLGVLNIKELFGIAAVRERKRVELVVELVEWREEEDIDRLGLEDRFFTILDVELPLVTIPVRHGRNISSIVEVAVRNQLLKFEGHHAGREFEERLNRVLASRRLARLTATDLE